MQFGTEFFWYRFSVTNRTMLYDIFVPVCDPGLLVQLFGADFQYVCHGHNI